LGHKAQQEREAHSEERRKEKAGWARKKKRREIMVFGLIHKIGFSLLCSIRFSNYFEFKQLRTFHHKIKYMEPEN